MEREEEDDDFTTGSKSEVLTGRDCESDGPGFEPWHCYLMKYWLWAGSYPSQASVSLFKNVNKNIIIFHKWVGKELD